MVNPVGSPAPAIPAKKAEGKKEETKPESKSPAPEPAPKPNTGNTGSGDVNTPTGGLDPKTSFAVTQGIKKPNTGNTGGSPFDDPADKQKPDKNSEKGDDKDDGSMGLEIEDKPEKMTNRKALDTLRDNDNEGLHKLDIAKDKIKNEKEDPDGDDKISSEDFELALEKDDYLTKEEKEAATFLYEEGAWDVMNGKDTKATYDEIDDYYDTTTAEDDPNGDYVSVLDEIDVLADRRDNGIISDPDPDGIISTRDLALATDNRLSPLNEKEKEAANFLFESDEWDEINGKDNKASVDEIVDFGKETDNKELAKAIEILNQNFIGD